MEDRPIVLRVLLRQRHWKYQTFCREYDKAAKPIDPSLVGCWPSRAQYQRWLAGELRGMPYPDSCRVLEAMFPGWTAEQLFAPADEQQLARIERGDASSRHGGAADPPRLAAEQSAADRFSDVTAVYATRSEFISGMPVHTIFDPARCIRACGLSLNLICQQYAAQKLISLVEGGTQVQCLFLDPDGQAIAAREQEEGYPAGQLADLTRINIQTLRERVRGKLTDPARERLELAVYDQTIRFNIILIDDRAGIIQPYLPAARGIDSPTFVLRRRWQDAGLLPTFDNIFCSLWQTGRPL